MSLMRNVRIRELFAELHARDAMSRRLALERDDTLDPEIRAEVEALLEEHDKISGFLEQPVLGSAFGIGTPEARASAPPRLPDRIAAYTIIRVLGEGGMGVVYLAEQERPKRLVALKVVRPGLSSASVLRRFEHESEILARLEHPGIARIYEAGCADAGFGPQPYFAMELIAGVPLDFYARAHELDHAARLSLIASACDGVHHAHQKGIVHRDLKPANILVDPSGQPKILDFGVARLVGTGQEATALATQTGELVGTLPYMSPEQLSDDPRDVDIRSDVYSLGVITFELLAGRLPLGTSGMSLVEAVRLVRSVEPPRLGTIDRRFGGDVEAIVSKALEKDRNGRYASASELAADIRRHLAREPIVARPAGRLLRLGRWAHRNPALAALFLVLLIGVVVLGILLKITNDAVRSEARQTQIAERRGDDLRQMADAAIFQVHEAIKDLPGATEARAQLLALSIKHLEALPKDASDNAQARSRARAYGIIADLQGAPGSVNLGDASAALANYDQAIAILKRLSTDASLADWAAWELTSVELRRSRVLQTSERTVEALAAARHALEQREAWVATHPRDPDGPRGVTAARSVVLPQLIQVGSLQEAAELATRIVHENEAAATGDPEAQLDLVKALDALAAVALFTRADVSVALGHSRRALGLLDPLLEARPFSVELMSMKGTVLSRIAYALDLAGDFGPAAEMSEQAIRQFEKLHAADPADLFHAVRLAEAFGRKTSVARRASKPREAEAAALSARDIVEKIAITPALKDRLRFLRANTERDLAAALADLDRIPEALDAFGRAVAIYEEAMAKDPAHEGLKVAASSVLVQVAQLRAKTRDERKTWEPYYERAERLLTSASAGPGGNTEVAQHLAACQTFWGNALVDDGALADAVTQYEKARAIGERLLAEAPASARLATDLSEVVYNLARALYQQGKGNAAVRELERATEIIGAASRAHPDDPMVQSRLAKILPTHSKIFTAASLESRAASVPLPRLLACARTFLTASDESGGDPAIARRYAEVAVARTKHANVEALALCADAAAACDDPEQAARLAAEALALLPAADGSNAELRERLAAITGGSTTRAETRSDAR